jgi:hypothetical protein
MPNLVPITSPIASFYTAQTTLPSTAALQVENKDLRAILHDRQLRLYELLLLY